MPKLNPHDFRALSEYGRGTLRTDRVSANPKMEPAIHVSGAGFRGAVVNFFRGVGAYIAKLWGGQYSEDRAARAQEAYGAFKERLVFQVGADSAQQILDRVRDQKKADPPNEIKVGQVKLALSMAQLEAQLHNDECVARCMPTSEASQQKLRDLSKKAGVQDVEAYTRLFDPNERSHPENAHSLYFKMTSGAVWLASKGQTTKVPEKQVETYAERTLHLISKLGTADDVGKVSKAFRSLVDASKEVLIRLAHGLGDGEGTCMRAYREALASLTESLRGIAVPGPMSEEGSHLVSAALGEAMQEITPEQRRRVDEIDINSDYDEEELPGFKAETHGQQKAAMFALISCLSTANSRQYFRPREPLPDNLPS